MSLFHLNTTNHSTTLNSFLTESNFEQVGKLNRLRYLHTDKNNYTTDYYHCVVIDKSTDTPYCYMEMRTTKKTYKFLVDSNAVVTKLDGGKLGVNYRMFADGVVTEYINSIQS
jgi:hypothetical protein